MSSLYTVRPATKQDQSIISSLIGFEYYVHRHLDWRTAFDWLDYQPYLLMQRDNRLVAALACPPDPPGVAWIRLFATSSSLPPSKTWGPLFEQANSILQQDNKTTIVALALQEWFEELIERSGFQHHQNIVVLQWSGKPPERRTIPVNLIIRPMLVSDLPEVEVVDRGNLPFFGDPVGVHRVINLLGAGNVADVAIPQLALAEHRRVGNLVEHHVPLDPLVKYAAAHADHGLAAGAHSTSLGQDLLQGNERVVW